MTVAPTAEVANMEEMEVPLPDLGDAVRLTRL